MIKPAPTDRTLLTAAPAWSRKVWTDLRFIYLEIPVLGEAPLIVKYAFTEGGLTKALAQIDIAYRASLPVAGYAKVQLDHPKTKFKIKGKPQVKPKVDQAERDALAEVLRKAGITK